jgi:hypothetical protein
MERARLALKRATQKLNVVYKQAGSWHMLMLVLFALGLFLGLYVLSKMWRIGRAVTGH